MDQLADRARKDGGPVALEGGGEVQVGKQGLLKSVGRARECPGVLSHPQPGDGTSVRGCTSAQDQRVTQGDIKTRSRPQDYSYR